jgi:hypothetical protein
VGAGGVVCATAPQHVSNKTTVVMMLVMLDMFN